MRASLQRLPAALLTASGLLHCILGQLSHSVCTNSLCRLPTL